MFLSVALKYFQSIFLIHRQLYTYHRSGPLEWVPKTLPYPYFTFLCTLSTQQILIPATNLPADKSDAIWIGLNVGTELSLQCWLLRKSGRSEPGFRLTVTHMPLCPFILEIISGLRLQSINFALSAKSL